MNKDLTPRLVTPHTSILGEGPVWDPSVGSICWLDIHQGVIHEYHPAKDHHTSMSVPEMIGTIALCRNGNYLAALQSGIGSIDRDSGEFVRLSSLEKEIKDNRFNDGKCDPAGRFWVGSMSIYETTGAGNLYMLDQDLAYKIMIPNVTISNGLAWSPAEDTFYYIDTPTQEIVAYDYDHATGDITNKRVVIDFQEEQGFPDGMTIDSEGMLWIAHWEGWQVSRWDPTSGTKLLSIALPVAKVTSCAFGGESLEDLYITSAMRDLTEAELVQQPLAGGLFVVEGSGYKGITGNYASHC